MKRILSLAVCSMALAICASAVPPDPVPKNCDHEAVLSSVNGAASGCEFTLTFYEPIYLVAEDVIKVAVKPYVMPAMISVVLEPTIKPPNIAMKWQCRGIGLIAEYNGYRQPAIGIGLELLKLDRLL